MIDATSHVLKKYCHINEIERTDGMESFTSFIDENKPHSIEPLLRKSWIFSSYFEYVHGNITLEEFIHRGTDSSDLPLSLPESSYLPEVCWELEARIENNQNDITGWVYLIDRSSKNEYGQESYTDLEQKIEARGAKIFSI